MQIADNVYLIRKDFDVTPAVKRYVNIYLITRKNCYLIDSGVAGSEKLIGEYLHSIGRNMSDIKGIFLTHAHPDHVGAAAAIKRITDCTVYAPSLELDWIEDINKQYRQRPIPNFYTLLPESVKVDVPLQNGESVLLEDGIEIHALLTQGHSHGSMSFMLGNNLIFTGDAIPVAHDLPIFVDYEQSLYSLDVIKELSTVQYFCPAWDEVYDRTKLREVINDSKQLLYRLKDAVHQVETEYKHYTEGEKLTMIFKQADILQYIGNPLVIKSVEACKLFPHK